MGLINPSTIAKATSKITAPIEKAFKAGKTAEVASDASKGSGLASKLWSGAKMTGSAVGTGTLFGVKAASAVAGGTATAAGNALSGAGSSLLKLGAVYGIIKLLANSNVTENLSKLVDKTTHKSDSNDKSSDKTDIANYHSAKDNGQIKTVQNVQQYVNQADQQNQMQNQAQNNNELQV